MIAKGDMPFPSPRIAMRLTWMPSSGSQIPQASWEPIALAKSKAISRFTSSAYRLSQDSAFVEGRQDG